MLGFGRRFPVWSGLPTCKHNSAVVADPLQNTRSISNRGLAVICHPLESVLYPFDCHRDHLLAVCAGPWQPGCGGGGIRTANTTLNGRNCCPRAHRPGAATSQGARRSSQWAKSRYLTGISHELRSPLNAILGYAQLLENDESVPAHRKEALGVIRRSSEYLADLIEGLLDIPKIEAGRLDLHRDQVRIDLLMEQLVTMFRLQAEERGLVFTYHCPLPLPERVTTDEKRLRQILINLLSNAIKYTDRGSVSLTLRYRSQVAEFTVRDTGEGIAPDNIERIFRPFERIRTPGQSRTGTGLGLTITRLLTEMMGGDIAVESEPGQGSVFKVSLMLSSLHSSSPHSIMAPARRIYGYHGTRLKVLLVDDASHRQVIRAMLSPLGFEIRDIGNALHVLETARTE